MEKATLIYDCHGRTVSVWADADSDSAAERLDELNAESRIDGVLDPDWPYTSETWSVKS